MVLDAFMLRSHLVPPQANGIVKMNAAREARFQKTSYNPQIQSVWIVIVAVFDADVAALIIAVVCRFPGRLGAPAYPLAYGQLHTVHALPRCTYPIITSI
jgi:hypothetical protein